MGIKKHKIICLIMIIFMAVSGMYFDDFEAASVFECAPIEKASYIKSADITITDVQACTSEMLGAKGNTCVRQLGARFAGSCREAAKLSLEFLCLDIFSLKEGKFFTGLNEIQLSNCIQNELVTNYIHRSDGKKR